MGRAPAWPGAGSPSRVLAALPRCRAAIASSDSTPARSPGRPRRRFVGHRHRLAAQLLGALALGRIEQLDGEARQQAGTQRSELVGERGQRPLQQVDDERVTDAGLAGRAAVAERGERQLRLQAVSARERRRGAEGPLRPYVSPARSWDWPAASSSSTRRRGLSPPARSNSSSARS